jgi:hypothetical protein
MKLINDKAYRYVWQAGVKMYYPRHLSSKMLSLTIVDFFLCDTSIEGSTLESNEWFIVIKTDDFYFNCIEELSTHENYIETYSIGQAKDQLAVIRLTGNKNKDVLIAFLDSEYSYMYPKAKLKEHKERFLEVTTGTKTEPDYTWGVLFHSTKAFNNLVEKCGLDKEDPDDKDLIKILENNEYDEKIIKQNLYFNSKEYETST